MSQRTEIAFYSRIHRTVVIRLKFAADDRPATLPYAFDHAPSQNVAVDHVGRAVLPRTTLGRGLHKLILGPLARAAQVRAIRTSDDGARTSDENIAKDKTSCP